MYFKMMMVMSLRRLTFFLNFNAVCVVMIKRHTFQVSLVVYHRNVALKLMGAIKIDSNKDNPALKTKEIQTRNARKQSGGLSEGYCKNPNPTIT